MQIHKRPGPLLMRRQRASECDWPYGRRGTPGPAERPTRDCWTRRPWQLWSGATCPRVLWRSGRQPILWWTQSLPRARAPCSSCRGSCGSAPPPRGRRRRWLPGRRRVSQRRAPAPTPPSEPVFAPVFLASQHKARLLYIMIGLVANGTGRKMEGV